MFCDRCVCLCVRQVRVLQDSDLWAKMACGGKQHVSSNFAPEKLREDVAGLMEAAAAHRRTSY